MEKAIMVIIVLPFVILSVFFLGVFYKISAVKRLKQLLRNRDTF
uniref:Aladin n=1 Tax=Rhizophora mucronata TaxID=61149 RepID=A0A2P2KPF1_RHIMU